MSLKHVYDIIEEIRSFSGRLDKESIINKYRDDDLFKKVVNYAYNPYLRFNTASVEFVEKTKHMNYRNVESIFGMLDFLSDKNGASNMDKQFLNEISSIDEETASIVNHIVSKDLKCGAAVKTFVKYFPEIPTHFPMLCIDDIDKYLKYHPSLAESCYSIKKDGVRCWCVHNTKTGDIKYLSRKGLEFPNLDTIFNPTILNISKKLIAAYPWMSNHQYIVYDGEVDAGKVKGFQKIMTQIRKLKDIDPDVFNFNIFDIAVDGVKQIDRCTMLYNILNDLNLPKVHLVEHWNIPTWVKTAEDLRRLAAIYINQGEEGIVVKYKNGMYERKRSKYWLKIKELYTVDVKVVGWEYGKPGTKNENVMGKLNCLLDDLAFNVGGGYTDDERVEFMDDTPEMIEVAYQGKTDRGIPRNNVFVRVREDK